MFFASYSPDAEHPHPQPGEYEPPEWVQPPADTVPFSVPLARVLGRTEHAALALRSAEVYPTGVQFSLLASVVRRGLDRRAWRDLAEDLYGHAPDADPDSGLRLGLVFADGTRVETHRAWPGIDGAADGPVLQLLGGGGGGGNERRDSDHRVWLWPFPPAGPITLHYRWTALGIGEGSTELDGDALAAVRDGGVPLWG
ncbi:MAG: hypothetical protein QM598_04940 [Protaetiibacter sp.]